MAARLLAGLGLAALVLAFVRAWTRPDVGFIPGAGLDEDETF